MYEMGNSETLSGDANLMFCNGFKQSSNDESTKYIDYMNTDLNQSQPSISASGVGLARYRSAPNSFLSTLLDDNEIRFDDFLGVGDSEAYDLGYDPTAVKAKIVQEQQREYCVERSDNPVEVQVQGDKVSGLARQSSSPAGFFSNLTPQKGFAFVGDVRNFGTGNGVNGKPNASKKLNDHIHLSSSSRYMPQIPEYTNESSNQEEGQLGNGTSSNNFYVPIFENNSWNESSLGGLKRSREVTENQNGNDKSYPNRLTHHASLPKTCGEMAAVEKYLQFQQEVVPCKIRAKRGHATHPRSIAERMRRTRISDRMKILQDLFPNMDKQTNTADMLDQVVEYINDLQNQVQTLTGKKAKCTCSK